MRGAVVFRLRAFAPLGVFVGDREEGEVLFRLTGGGREGLEFEDWCEGGTDNKDEEGEGQETAVAY